jgi:putative peptidoglycan lipid II flippase
LTYGWMVMQVPETLLGTAIGTALLPTLSEFAVKQQWDEFTKVISRAVRILTALTIPIFVILSLGLRPLISLAFGFDAVGTDLILNVSRAFLFGLIAHSIIEVGARSFYSIQNAKIPLLASAVTIITFLIFGNLLVNRFGAVGIAASVTIAFSVEMLLIMILLIRRFHFNVGIVPTLSRTILASIAGTAVIIGISLWIPINPVFSALISMGTAVSVAFFIIKKDIKELRNL